MSAIPEDFIKKTSALSDEVTRPFPGARKVYVGGSRPDIRVPMREVAQAPTPASFGAEENPPITVYDTSGPFTDPDVRIDLLRGMPDVRSTWIEERGDTEQLAGPSSDYGRARQHDPALAHLRFVLLCSAFAALYLTGAISALTFMLAVTFVSFRITGTYVLNTIVQRPFGGFDWGIAAFIVAIAGASLAIGGPMSIQGLRVAFLVEPISVGGYSLTLGAYVPYVPYLAFLYMVTRNLVDFSRHFSALRPGAAAAPAETEKLA